MKMEEKKNITRLEHTYKVITSVQMRAKEKKKRILVDCSEENPESRHQQHQNQYLGGPVT